MAARTRGIHLLARATDLSLAATGARDTRYRLVDFKDDTRAISSVVEHHPSSKPNVYSTKYGWESDRFVKSTYTQLWNRSYVRTRDVIS